VKERGGRERKNGGVATAPRSIYPSKRDLESCSVAPIVHQHVQQMSCSYFFVVT